MTPETGLFNERAAPFSTQRKGINNVEIPKVLEPGRDLRGQTCDPGRVFNFGGIKSLQQIIIRIVRDGG